MDNFLEILLPLLFFAVYFISQFFGKKSGDDEEAPKQENVPDDMRKIREELRRKIAERRGQKPGEPQPQNRKIEPVPVDDARGGSVLKESRKRRGMVDEKREAFERSGEGVPSYKKPVVAESNFERDLEMQMEEVRRSEAKVESARKLSRERAESIRAGAKKKSIISYRQFLREALEDPNSLQKSFVLYEVFGTPVGMRRDSQTRPSFDL